MYVSESGRNLKWLQSLRKDKRRAYLLQHPKSKFHTINKSATPIPSSGIVKKGAAATIKAESPMAKKFFISLKNTVAAMQKNAKNLDKAARAKLDAKLRLFKQMLSERNTPLARNRFSRWKKIRGMQLVKLNRMSATSSDSED